MRYIGNKNKLLDEIDLLLDNKGLKTKGLRNSQQEFPLIYVGDELPNI